MNKSIYIVKMSLVISAFFSILLLYSQQGTSDNNDNYIYIQGSDLLQQLYLLKFINTYNKDTITPYYYSSYYKFDMKIKKLSKIDKRKYLSNNFSSPNREWAVEYILFKDKNNQWDTKHNLFSTVDPEKVIDLGRVKNYAWSSKGDRISFITCRPSCPTIDCPPDKWIYEAFIYNIKENSKKKIKVTAYDLSWPSFDNNIYFNLAEKWEDPRIVRYHPDSGKIEETLYESLNFSPSGKYYLFDHYDTESNRVYKREPHDDIEEINKDLENLTNLYNDAFWLADGHSLLLQTKNNLKEFIVYDVEKGKVSKTIEGAFIGLDRSKRYGVFMKGADQFEVVDMIPQSTNSK